MKLNTLCLSASVVGVGLSVLTLQPAASLAAGINVDVERQACHFDRVRAMRGNRQTRGGEISEAKRRALWIRYRDCLGGKDKNYLLPAEFKYR